MNNVLTKLVIVVCFVTNAFLPAQEPPQLPGPEKAHKWLEKFVGDWSTNTKAEMGPGQSQMESIGSINSRMLGGFWVINELKGDWMGTPMNGIQTIGFDVSKKKYVGTWVDSSNSYIWHYEGTVDKADKTLTLEAEGPNFLAEGKTTKFQDIYEFTSADEIITYSKMLGEDGKWITFMKGTATRKK